MKINFVGPTYEMDSLSFSAQRLINMYPLIADVKSKSVTAMRNCAGIRLFADIGTGPIRGGITVSSKSRAFVVSGTDLYEIFTDGTSTNHGSLNSATGRVSMSDNGTQLAISDGVDGYTFTYASDAFAQITATGFTNSGVFAYQDGYTIYNRPDTDEFYISGINNSTSWDALDFTRVQSNPDNLVSILSDKTNLWCFGQESTEVYRNTGNVNFPFERIQGAVVPTGCAAPLSPQIIDNTVVWLGVDEQGRGVVWRAEGYAAVRVSTKAIEKRINSVSDFTQSYAWVYHEQGSVFYVLQIAGLDTTLVLDMATRQWHERSYKNPTTNENEPHRGSCHFFFGQKNLVGDRESGKIYELSLNYYDDNGDEMIKTRISPHYQDEKRLISHASFELDMEVGIGLTSGQGSDPTALLSYSDDGGHTYGNEMEKTIGAKGEYRNRVRWNRLGRARDRVYKLEISDPVFVQINEAYLNGV